MTNSPVGKKKRMRIYLGLPFSIKIQVIFRVLQAFNRHVLGPHVRHFAIVGFQINKSTLQSDKHKRYREYSGVYQRNPT